MKLELLNCLDALEAWLVPLQFSLTETATLAEAERSISCVQMVRLILLDLSQRLGLIEVSVLEDYFKVLPNSEGESLKDEADEVTDNDIVFPAAASGVLGLLERMAKSLEDDHAEQSRYLYLRAHFEVSSLVAYYWTGRLCERLRRLVLTEELMFATILRDWISTGRRNAVDIALAESDLAPDSDDQLLDKFKDYPENEISTVELFRRWNEALREVVDYESQLP